MKYTEKRIAAWHDTDLHRVVRTSKIIEYLQETANHQCEYSGLPLEKLRDERGLAFILGAISVKIYKPIFAYDEVIVKTWCAPTKGYIYKRFFEIEKGGEIILQALSTWVLIDINKKEMVRLSPDDPMNNSFYYDQPLNDAEFKKVRISKDAALSEVGKRKIVYSDIDYNMHMNNTHYPDMLCDFIEEMTSTESKYRISSISLSYVKESALGDVLTVYRGSTDRQEKILMQTKNSLGQVCLDAEICFETL